MARADICENEIIITLPVEKVTAGLKTELEEYFNHLPIKVIPVKKLSQAQNGLIHVLLKELGEDLGYTLLEAKEVLKERFAIATDILDFSTARCDMETANEFISFIIEEALDLGINLYIRAKQDKKYRHILEIDKMTERYVIACLRKRTCCICGRKHDEYNEIQLDHYDTVANTVGTYENDDGLHGRFLPLCSHHHFEKHSKSLKEFEDKYHIEGVYLNPQLVYDLLPVYKNHFKKFRKQYKEGKYGNLERSKRF